MMPAGLEILIADDERAVRDGLKALLSAERYVVRTARDGDEALRKFAERRPDLVLLDVMMPKMNGFAVCEAIRRADRLVPVVFLTAKDAEADQVRGFGLGADDYVSKTAPEALLLARVRRAVERADAMSAAAGRGSVVRVGLTTVDLMTLDVEVAGRKTAKLTKSEADLLSVLDADRGRHFTTDELISKLRGEGFACEDSMLYVHVSNLRRKLGTDGAHITWARGAGYRLRRTEAGGKGRTG